jgi:hypothetical protein
MLNPFSSVSKVSRARSTIELIEPQATHHLNGNGIIAYVTNTMNNICQTAPPATAISSFSSFNSIPNPICPKVVGGEKSKVMY